MRRSKSENHWLRLVMNSTGLYFLLSLLLFGLTSDVRAQDPTDVVRVLEGALSVDHVRQGSSFRVAVELEIKFEFGNRHEWISTYHVNSGQPYDPQLIPTKLELEEVKGFTVSLVKYPRGRDVSLKFSSKPLSVYSAIPGKRIILMFSAQAAPDIPLGQHYLRGKLTYQPCSDQGCGTMKITEIQIPVSVVDAKTKVHRINKHYFGVSARDYLLIPVRLIKGEVLTHRG